MREAIATGRVPTKERPRPPPSPPRDVPKGRASDGPDGRGSNDALRWGEHKHTKRFEVGAPRSRLEPGSSTPTPSQDGWTPTPSQGGWVPTPSHGGCKRRSLDAQLSAPKLDKDMHKEPSLYKSKPKPKPASPNSSSKPNPDPNPNPDLNINPNPDLKINPNPNPNQPGAPTLTHALGAASPRKGVDAYPRTQRRPESEKAMGEETWAQVANPSANPYP